MKILIVSMLFYPDSRIGAFRPTNFAKNLVELGHEVTVITTDKNGEVNLPGLTIHQIGMGRFIKVIDNLLLHRKPHRLASANDTQSKKSVGMSPLKVALLLLLDHVHGWSWTRKVRRYVKANPIGQQDILISSFGPLGSFFAGRMLSKNNVASKLVLDLRDRIPNARYPNIFNRRYLRYEHIIMREADGVILVSQGQKESFLRDLYLKPSSKVHVITNGYERNLEATAKVPEGDELSLCYTGQLYGRYQAMAWLINILDQAMREDDISIRVNYAGPEGRRLQEIAKGTAIRITDHGVVSHEKALNIQQNSDILVALAWNEPNSLGILSGKFFEYMASKKPVISLVTGSLPDAEITTMVRKLRLGIACEEFSKEEDEKELKRYIILQHHRKKSGEQFMFDADSAELEKFDYSNLTLELEKICKDIINAK